jgi:DNA-binding SARP family transcriptional activator
MRIELFGPLQVHDGTRRLRGSDLGGAKPRSLLELLLLARGRTVSKERLAEWLWSTTPPRSAASALEHYVCVLRRRLFTDQDAARQVLATESGAYRFDTSMVDLDLDVFDRLVRQSEHSDDTRSRVLLTEAVEIARRDLLDDAPYAPWAIEERELYRSRVARAHLWLARDCMTQQHFIGSLRHAEDSLQFAPYSEEAFRTIMVADHALGHADLARRAHLRCRQTLAEHLGVDPTSETEAVGAAIDGGVPALELVDAFVRRSLSTVLAAA